MGCGGSKGVGHQINMEAPSELSGSLGEEEVNKVHSMIRWNKPMRDGGNGIKEFINSEERANCRDNGREATTSREGITIPARKATGNRPVHIAAQNGFLPILKHLVSMGCSVNAQNTRGNTGMHMAVEYNYPKIVKYLTQIGADPDIKNDAGWKSMDGIDGIKCPSSPDYHLSQIQQARTSIKLRDALTNALTATNLDIGVIANLRIRYFKKNPDLWTEECDEVMKELIAINAGKAN